MPAPVSHSRRNPRPKADASGRQCALGYCRAPVPPGRSPFCSAEHRALSKLQSNNEHRLREQVLEQLAGCLPGGTQQPPEFVGWLVTQEGAVLPGRTVLELRAASAEFLAALAAATAAQEARDPKETPQQRVGILRRENDLLIRTGKPLAEAVATIFGQRGR